MSVNRFQARGFTLLEVLIAMAITAFIAVAAYTSLSTVISGVDRTREQGDRLHEISRAFGVLSRDLRLVVDRPVRDEFGQVVPALTGGPLARELLSLTRAGWHNTTGAPRSALQRIAYRLDGTALYRLSYPVLDRTPVGEPREVLLLEDVEEIRFSFLPSLARLEVDRDGRVDRRQWLENWVQDLSQPDLVPAPPVAVAVDVTLKDLGVIERLYVLPAL
ncbi:MAG: type II secretion system minor pseudopilin GspJ [Halieaceae bacterium]|nr:type II secretion system minor pseudopilin GspJ [Halieaceae bacterium]